MTLWTVQGRMKGGVEEEGLKDLALMEMKQEMLLVSSHSGIGEMICQLHRTKTCLHQSNAFIYMFSIGMKEKFSVAWKFIKEASFLVYNSRCLYSSLYKKGMCYFKK